MLDGRDIGTVIAPEAAAKLWVDADLAGARAPPLAAGVGRAATLRTLEALVDDLRRRDARDAGRATAPMVRADDAVLLDTTATGYIRRPPMRPAASSRPRAPAGWSHRSAAVG